MDWKILKKKTEKSENSTNKNLINENIKTGSQLEEKNEKSENDTKSIKNENFKNDLEINNITQNSKLPNQEIKFNNLEDIIMEINSSVKLIASKIILLHNNVEEMKSHMSTNNEYNKRIKNIEAVLDDLRVLIEKNISDQKQLTDNNFIFFSETLAKIETTIECIKEETDNVKTQLEFSQNVNNVSEEVSVELHNENNETANKLEKFHIVEMFIDNGEIKFRVSNQSTSFYMQQNEQIYTLIINETIYHTANIDSIERCFSIEGDKTGKYTNIKSANCLYNENTKEWKLINKGIIKGVNL